MKIGQLRFPVLLTGTLTGFAAMAEPQPESAFFSDFPTVLTVSRLEQSSAEAAAAVSVIDRETIHASGARNIPELLRLVPGFQVAPVNGHLHTATYHGLADQYSRRMQVLVDGRSVYQRVIGGVSWELLPVDVRDVERIEVVRGPNSVAYGSNAFLGVINIITRHPGVEPGAHLAVDYGENGVADLWAAYNGTFERGAFGLTAAQRKDDGLASLRDGSTHRHVNMKLDYSFTPNDTLEFTAAFARVEMEDGHEGAAIFEPNEPIGESKHASVRWQHSHGNGDETVLNAYVIEETLDETRDSPLLARPVDSGGRVTRYEAELHQKLSPIEDLRLVWGVTARRDEVDTPLFFYGQPELSENLYRAFTHLEWTFKPGTTLNTGLLLEDNDFTGSEFDFRLGVNHELDASQTVRAAISTATRTPLFFETRGDLRIQLAGSPFPIQGYVGNRELDAENILSGELGYLFSKSNLSFDVRLFYDQYDDMIYGVSEAGASPISWSGDNSVDHLGAEIQLDWRPTESSRLLATYSYVDADSSVAAFEDSTPEHTASLFGTYGFADDWLLSAGYYYTSPFRWIGQTNAQPTMEWLDLRLSKTFSLDGRPAEVALVGRNLLGNTVLFNNKEGNAALTNEIDTTVYVTASVSF